MSGETWEDIHKEELGAIRKRKPKCVGCDEEPASIGYGRKGDEIYPLGGKCFMDPTKREYFDGQSTY